MSKGFHDKHSTGHAAGTVRRAKRVAATALATSLSAGLLLVMPAASSAAEPYLGEIDYFAFNFAPRGWALCDGQILPINSNQALYSLMGTTFGGDGRTTFALPDMRGRSPVHDGGSAGPGLSHRTLGQRGGVESVTLAANQVPAHSHNLRGTTTTANQVAPAGHGLAATTPDQLYSDQAPNTAMRAGAIGSLPAGAHQNMAPYLVVNCAIATQGLFPSRN